MTGPAERYVRGYTRHLAGCDTRGGNWICAAGCPVAAQRTTKETTMCGCEKHHTPTADCTCICPEHRNFDRAYELAMQRYDEIRQLRKLLAESRRHWERSVLQHVLANAPANRPDGDVVPDWLGAISTAMVETRRQVEQ